MTEQAKQQVSEAKTIEEKIKAVNTILHDGEPKNVSVDNYSGFTGYKPQYIVDAMNAVFLGSWGFEEVSAEIVTHQTEKGTSSIAIAHVKVWLKGIDFQPASYGQSRVTKGDIGMPYRMLWNGTLQISPEARSGLRLAPSWCTSVHTIRYSILLWEATCFLDTTSQTS